VLRSGAYCDEIVMNLVNRRFVASWYDHAHPSKNAGDGFAYDAQACTAVDPLFTGPDAERPRRGGTQARDGRVTAASYPAGIVVTPDGQRLGKVIWGTPPPEKFVAELLAILAAHPTWSAPGVEEQAIGRAADQRPDSPPAQLADARVAFECADFARCLRRCAVGLDHGQGGLRGELLYLRGRALLCQRATGDARKALLAAQPLLAKSDLADDVALALAFATLQERDFEGARDAFADVARWYPTGDRAGEARYYEGLCHYKLGAKDRAKAVWRAHKQEMPLDRFARRSAASLGLPESQAFLNQELLEDSGWWW
jgi:hypothetical protein